MRRTSGTANTAMVSTPSVPAIGREKNALQSPSALIMEVVKFSSNMRPSTAPRITGATGKPLASMKNASSPNASITPMSNGVLLIANAPTVQKTRITGISTARGSSGLPDVPPLAQAAGIPGYDIGAWIGYAAAPGTPREILAKLSAEIRKAVESPDLRERFVALGFEPAANSPEEMAVFLKNEQQRYGDIIRRANIKVEQ